MEITPQPLQIVMPVISRIISELQILTMLPPACLRYVRPVIQQTPDGSLQALIIRCFLLRLVMQQLPVLTVIKTEIIQRLRLIAILVISRIILEQRIPIMPLPEFLLPVKPAIQQIQDGSPQRLVILPSL